MTRSASAASLFVVLACLGCATTKVTQVWLDEGYPGGKPAHVLVIAVAGAPTVQREIESQFARQFRDRGIRATEGFRTVTIGQRSAQEARDEIAAQVREQKADAVLVVLRGVSRTSEMYIPGMTIVHGMGYGGMGGVAVVASTAPTQPTTQGYSHDTKYLGMAVQLYDAQTEKLIWFMQTETQLTGAPQEEIRPFVSIVSRELFSWKPFR